MRRSFLIPQHELAHPVAITTANPLPPGTQGSAYSLTFSASGGQGNYQWFLLHDYSGTGLSMSLSGVLSGTPAVAGTCTLVIAVADSGGESAQMAFAITLSAASGLAITTSSPLPSATVGIAYSTTMAAVNGFPPYTWSITSDTPDTGGWLSINSSTGVLSGTPGTAETESLLIKVTDSALTSASAPFSLTVNSTGTPGALPVLTLVPSQTNANGPWTFGQGLAQGAVPSGFYISASAGASSIQAEIRNRWPDGSAKYAVLSGISSFTANVANSVQLIASSTAPTGANVAEPTSLPSTNVVFSPASGQYPLVSTLTCNINAVLGVAQGAWNIATPGRVRSIPGPVMSEFHYYQPAGSGALAVWWFVRAYSSGAVEVEYVIENGWFNIASGQIDYAATVTVGGVQVASIPHIANTIPWPSGSSNTATTISYADNLGPAGAVGPWIATGGYFYVNGDPSTIYQATNVTAGSVTTITCAGGLPVITSLSILGHFANSRWGGVAWQNPALGASVTPQHDPAYLRSTRLVPNYGYLSPSAAAYNGLASSLNPPPFSLGNWTFHMGDVGAQGAIGILPQWEALYCTLADPRAYAAAISNNRGAGRWPIHFRDETTGRVADYRSYPTEAMRQDRWSSTQPPAITGGWQGPWNIAHHPSNGYLPYLIEGRWSQLEALQFAAAFNILDSKTTNRTQGGAYQGVLAVSDPGSGPLTTRGAAWAWRTMAQAAAISPTALAGSPPAAADQAIQASFAKSMDDTVGWMYQNFVLGALNTGKFKNNIGWIGQCDQYTGTTFTGGPIPATQFWGGAWMGGFQGQALGHAWDLAIENMTSRLTLAVIRNFRDRDIIQRAQIDNVYGNYRRPAVYEWPYLSNTDALNPAFMTRPQQYSAYVAANSLNAALSTAPGGTLMKRDSDAAMSAVDVDNTGTGFAAQATLAPLAYAVDGGCVGARSALEIIATGSNYVPDLTNTSNNPQFGNLAATATSKPAWQSSLAPLTWTVFPASDALTQVMTYALPTGGSGSKPGICAFSGAAFNEVTSELILAAQGGHSDYGGNEVIKFSLNQGTPGWTLLKAPYPTPPYTLNGAAYYPDGTPSSRHGYGDCGYCPEFDRVMLFGASSVYQQSGGNGFDTVDGFSLTSKVWDAQGTWPSTTGLHSSGGNMFTVRDYMGNFWKCGNPDGKLRRWNLADASWTLLAGVGNSISGGHPFVYDPKRHIIFRLPHVEGAGFHDLSSATAAFTPVTLNDPNGFLNDCAPGGNPYAVEYCPERDSYLVVQSQTTNIYEVDATSYVVSAFALSGVPPTAGTAGFGLYFGRFRHVPALSGFVLMTAATNNIGFFRVS